MKPKIILAHIILSPVYLFCLVGLIVYLPVIIPLALLAWAAITIMDG